MQPEMIPLKGNTYPIRVQLRDLGGEFDREKKVWMVPADRIAEARRLLQPEPVRSARPQQKNEREPGRPQIDLATLNVLVRAQLRILHDAVSIIGKWDEKAEAKIHEFSHKIVAQGGKTDGVLRTLDEFREKLYNGKSPAAFTDASN
jgi:hypothetical protein